MKLYAIEEMCTRHGLRIVSVEHSKRIKVTLERDDGARETQSFPRTVHEHHALKNREAALRRFARGSTNERHEHRSGRC
jgi:hypothetical protein